MLRRLSRNAVLCEIVLFSLLLVIGSSCINTRGAKYFPDAGNGTIATNTPIPESVIQKNDILSITISSPNAEASAILNPQTANANDGPLTSATLGGSTGYLVNSDGQIQLPLIGNIKAEGLTKNQLKDQIVASILEKKLLVDPLVSIRFTNFRVTVLGEVNRPSVVNVPNEKISLLEALGLAGDITIYGKKDNVMVIREENNKKTINRINLNSSDLFNSQFYYLRSNDIVYVEPNKARVASAGRSNQWLPILFSGLSLAAIVADRVIN
ncbi:MAG: polysaccharide biosynthesis/export family protein [Chitinophagaceae bacterium]|jgi:polysaccharide export outer membrane protein|nr:polysaccharide biosynthesis/export family protein [Chitinophagaceae bacterium]